MSKKVDRQEAILAGFGGQGIMLLGSILAYSGMTEGKHVSWIPSYGPEMRGGTANCTVIISPKEIGSPVVESPDTVMAFNKPSMDKFTPTVKKGGLLMYNSSLIDTPPSRDDIEIVAIPATEIADRIGNTKLANMVMAGAYLERTGIIEQKSILAALKLKMSGDKAKLLDLNEKAILEGARYASEKK
jgi:2-oxoglutarate ferredoxin oxidoreductase subunit gamma